MGKRRYRVQFRTREDGTVIYPPYTFFLGPDKGFLYVEGQPGACWRCGAVGHRMAECGVKRCRYCYSSAHESGECAAPRTYSLCGSEHHLFRDCPHRSGRATRLNEESGEGSSAGLPHGEAALEGFPWLKLQGHRGRLQLKARPERSPLWQLGLQILVFFSCPRASQKALCRVARALLVLPPCRIGAEWRTVSWLASWRGGSGSAAAETTEGAPGEADGAQTDGKTEAVDPGTVLGSLSEDGLLSMDAMRALDRPPAVQDLPPLGSDSWSSEDSVLEEEMPESGASLKRAHPGEEEPPWSPRGRHPLEEDVDPSRENRLDFIVNETICLFSGPAQSPSPAEREKLENWPGEEEKAVEVVLEEAAVGVQEAVAGAAAAECVAIQSGDSLSSAQSAGVEGGAEEVPPS